MESPSQPPPPPLEPDVEIESPHRPLAGRESPRPEKGVHWPAVSDVVGILSLIGFLFFGWLNYRNSGKDVEGVAEGLKKSAENTAIASKDPDEAAATVARVQREPAASPARVQREPGDASLLQRARDDAILLQQQGKIEEAIEKWRSIANLVGEEDRQLRALAWFAIGSLHSEGEGADLEASLDAYTRGIALNPAFAEAYYTNRGTVKEDLNRHADAIADYSQAIALNPAFAEAYYNRGIAKKALGRPADAIADYSQAIALNPTHAGAYNNRGIAKKALGRPADAIADYSQAIALNPALAGVYYNRGNAKREGGRINEAREDYQRALNLAQEAGDENIVMRAKHRLSRRDNNEAS